MPWCKALPWWMLLIDFKMSTSVNTMTEMKAILEMVGYIKLVIFAHRARETVMPDVYLEAPSG